MTSHNYVSLYEMNSNHAFRINKSDVSIITGSNVVVLNVVLQLKKGVVGLIGSNCCIVFVQSQVCADAGSNHAY